MSNTLTEQQAIPPAAFDDYPGKWIAVRDGAVVASADSLGELRANPEVTREDAVYVVPEQSTYFF